VAAAAQQRDTDTPQNDKRRAELRERLSAVVSRLQQEADQRVSDKHLVEQRWLEDIRQYHGRYESGMESRLKTANKSTVFVTKTRAKTNAMEARLSDMLFPTDDKNWGIGPTPVPELTASADEAVKRAKQAAAAADAQPENQKQQALAAAKQQQDTADELQGRIDEAKKRSKAMEQEIEDHLRECSYQAEMRDVIRDACRLGTGIAKGPVVSDKARSSWKAKQIKEEESGRTFTVYEMEQARDKKAAFHRVDPWSIFPDMDASSAEDCESWYERHMMNKKQLRKLAKSPGFDADAIRRLLMDDPKKSAPQYVSDLRALTGAHHDAKINRYHVWEYHGTLTAEEMRDLATATGDPDMVSDMPEDIDPLEEVQATIWFCQDEILKFGIHPLDSCESIYSVFNLEKDETSIFGFGVPYICRDSQAAVNGAWRMMLDNADLSTAPQIVVNEEVITPADGKWGLKGGKVWKRKTGAPQQAAAFESYDIASNQGELAAIVAMATEHMDEESMIPVIAQGEQGAHATDTLGGMSILMNASNVVFRRIVKNFDDDMTTPNIRRFYDWQMQFSPKEHIKGDFDVDARGTSVLLVRELQAQNIMAFLMNFGTNPNFARFLKKEGMPAMRLLVQTMMLPADEVLITDDEYEQQKSEEQPAPDYEMLKLENEMNLAKENSAARMQELQFERDTKLMVEASKRSMTLEQLRAHLMDKQAERESGERKMAAEIAYTDRQQAREPEATTGGGYV